MITLLHHTIAESAAGDPSREGFRCGDRAITYGDWQRRSNQLAQMLVDRGVQRGDRVGIYLPRSIETAIAVYGIMKAGAAFVPLDPALPAGGLQQLIGDCGIQHLVTHHSRLPILSQLPAKGTALGTLAGVDPQPGFASPCVSWNDIHQYPDRLPPVQLQPDDLAYIMYSSGSTGRPKGIMHTHASGLSYARLSRDTYDVQADDRIANHSPLHFDMSTLGYFTGPLAAATTVLIPEAHTKVPSSLAQLIAHQRITIWYSVPLALIQLLLRAPLESLDLSQLRWVLYGGEPFPPKHLYRLMAKWPQARFSNVYGPAETNQCTYFHIPPVSDLDESALQSLIDAAEPIPIGKLWPDTEGRVLDSEDRPVAAGESGQLAVHSPTMMAGYWQQPERNQRAWYTETVDGTEQQFYRTGDLVREQCDGELVFLGAWIGRSKSVATVSNWMILNIRWPACPPWRKRP